MAGPAAPGALTYTPPAGTVFNNAGSYTLSVVAASTANYNAASASVAIVVLGRGSKVVGTELWLIEGSTSDQVGIQPVGASSTGSTGVRVTATLTSVSNGKTSAQFFSATYAQSFTAIHIFGYGGADNIQMAASLSVNAMITEGNGADAIQTGNGNDVITVGNGNDSIQTGNGNKTITAGNGNDTVKGGTGADAVSLGGGKDSVQLAGGNNTVTLGNGNDAVTLGNGNNVATTGNGTDAITAGKGDNLIAAGLGQHTVQVGNGSNILIDGSATLTSPSADSLRQVLNNWISGGKSPANVASIRSRLHVTDNRSHANKLTAGTGLDWFWATYAKDSINRKPTDLLN